MQRESGACMDVTVLIFKYSLYIYVFSHIGKAKLMKLLRLL